MFHQNAPRTTILHGNRKLRSPRARFSFLKPLIIAATLIATTAVHAADITVECKGPPALQTLLIRNHDNETAARLAALFSGYERRNDRDHLQKLAEDALHRGPFTVTNKTILPPSGDKHDYMNYASQWWPDPTSRPNRKWIQIDGKRNPNNRIDSQSLTRFAKDLRLLSLGNASSSENEFIFHARELVETWFLNPETSMNPNARYGSVIPGRNRANFPVAEFSNLFTHILEALRLGESSTLIDPAKSLQLQKWFESFLFWMKDDPVSKRVSYVLNNRGTHFDYLQALIGAYIGSSADVKQAVQRFTRRIGTQYDHAGLQPLEMKRAKNLSYHIYSLNTALKLAIIAKHELGEQLMFIEARNGASLSKSLQALLPYATGYKKWPYGQKLINAEELNPEWCELLSWATQLTDSANVWDALVPLAKDCPLELRVMNALIAERFTHKLCQDGDSV